MKNSCWKKGIWMLFILLSNFVGKAQQESVKWLTLEEVREQYRQEPRPYLFDFYTQGCTKCRQMQRTVYTDPIVASFVNRHFYPVRVDMHSADTLVFREKNYEPVWRDHELISGLAMEMLDGNLTCPSTVFVHDAAKFKLNVPGALTVSQMRGYLVYLIENAWKSVTPEEFVNDFELVFEQETNEPDAFPAYWTAFTDLEHERQIRPKKILLFLEGSWNNSGKMMERILFADSLFSTEIQEHFYCLRLDVQACDTIPFFRHTFHNAGPQHHHLHQLAIALSNKILRVPGIYFFDEEGKLMESFFYYISPRKGQLILDYIGSDLFKSMTWYEYVKVREKETI